MKEELIKIHAFPRCGQNNICKYCLFINKITDNCICVMRAKVIIQNFVFYNLCSFSSASMQSLYLRSAVRRKVVTTSSILGNFARQKI